MPVAPSTRSAYGMQRERYKRWSSIAAASAFVYLVTGRSAGGSALCCPVSSCATPKLGIRVGRSAG
eukprot:3798860-Prymnesium_polylepis.2